MPHKSLASSPALKGGASARQNLVNKKYSEKICFTCGNPSGHWRHWPNVPGEHYVVPVHAEQSDFHSFQGTAKRRRSESCI
jgi:hypothetical protein